MVERSDHRSIFVIISKLLCYILERREERKREKVERWQKSADDGIRRDRIDANSCETRTIGERRYWWNRRGLNRFWRSVEIEISGGQLKAKRRWTETRGVINSPGLGEVPRPRERPSSGLGCATVSLVLLRMLRVELDYNSGVAPKWPRVEQPSSISNILQGDSSCFASFSFFSSLSFRLSSPCLLLLFFFSGPRSPLSRVHSCLLVARTSLPAVNGIFSHPSRSNLDFSFLLACPLAPSNAFCSNFSFFSFLFSLFLFLFFFFFKSCRLTEARSFIRFSGAVF